MARLTIDASIAGAAGNIDAEHPRSKYCRDFLLCVRKVSHRIVMTPEIAEEWTKHRSTFSTGWLVAMTRIGNVEELGDSFDEELRDRIRAAPSEPIGRIMARDARLIEAASKADRVVASLDDKVRGHFGRAAREFEELRVIAWVNPSKKTERPIGWLRKGAPAEVHRLLGFEPK